MCGVGVGFVRRRGIGRWRGGRVGRRVRRRGGKGLLGLWRRIHEGREGGHRRWSPSPRLEAAWFAAVRVGKECCCYGQGCSARWNPSLLGAAHEHEQMPSAAAGG